MHELDYFCQNVFELMFFQDRLKMHAILERRFFDDGLKIPCLGTIHTTSRDATCTLFEPVAISKENGDIYYSYKHYIVAIRPSSNRVTLYGCTKEDAKAFYDDLMVI